jgi:hypothetical protein
MIAFNRLSTIDDFKVVKSKRLQDGRTAPRAPKRTGAEALFELAIEVPKTGDRMTDRALPHLHDYRAKMHDNR